MDSDDSRPTGLNSADFLAGGGDMGQRTRAHDWARTPLGDVGQWPQSLRAAVSIMLNSRYPIALYWGQDLTLLYNDAWRPIPGGKHPWVLGKPAREVWPELWDTLEPLADRVFTTGEGTWAEDQLLPMHRHGFTEECYFNYTWSPVRGEGGRIDGIFNVVVETTERVLGERRLQTLSELGARVQETQSSDDACQRAARILADNDADVPFALIYLCGAEEGVARRVAGTGVPDGHPAAPRDIALDSSSPWPVGRVVATGEALEIGDVPALVGGHWNERISRALIVPLKVAGESRPVGAVVVGVNPRRELDERYRSFFELLAGHIGSAISNARAFEAERKRTAALAEIDRAKTAFFSNVSHEFRTPLTLMLGPLADALANANAPSTVRDDLELAHRNGLRLLKLVNSLLDFARIEAGRAQASFEPLDLASLTEELASSFRSAMERAGIEFAVECGPLTEPVYVDPDMWEKIVLNLLSNAFKFTLAGHVRVALSQDAHNAVLEIADSGVGIPRPELPRLFERFHRVEGVKGRTHEGTGIGLALVYELVKLHGGSIAADSEEGRGTTFRVTVPLGASHLPADRVRAARTLASTATGAQPFVQEALRWLPGKGDAPPLEHTIELDPSITAGRVDGAEGARVLVADDNADMRAYLQRLLSARFEVQAVNDGAAALAAARANRPDLVVSDVMMPELDGFGLLKALRDDSATADVPVILLSARAGEEATLEGLQAGADDYLIKPFSSRELLGRASAHIERGRLQRALSALDERLAFALSAVGMAPWEWRPDTDSLAVTAAIADVLGLPPESSLRTGAEFRALLHAEDRERVAIERAAVLAGGRGASYRAKYRIVRPLDGAVAWIEESGAVRHDEPSGRVYLTGVVMDVTDRVRVEDERAASFERERAARAEAERASVMKDEFLATLSHELRTPLNAIVGWAHLLNRNGAKAEDSRQGLAAIERNARIQAQMIEDLLDMSRIISGKVRLDVQRVNVANVIEQAIQSVLPSADARATRLLKVLDPGAGPVMGDPSRLQQIVWNLLSNAIKFTPKGGKVQVVLACVNSHLEISVSDDGEGIEPSFLPHVFDRFRQADASTTRRHGGLGLGLSIVKQLVELHGGSVEARSAGKERGATFIVRLPMAPALHADVQGDRRHPRAEPPEPARFEVPDLDGVKVLVVDDEADARDIIERILAESRAEVWTAASAAEALQVVPRVRPDVLLSDIGMPGEDGYELIRKIRALAPSEGGRTAAVALTAFARSEDRSRALMAGYQMHVAKPVTPAELLVVVASLCGRVSTARSN